MISFNKDRLSDPPKSLRGKPAIEHIQEVISKAPAHEVGRIYRSEPIKKKMRQYFGDKCIYCESIPIASSAFRIDHYRPKDGVKGIDPKMHFGYYWLALEWTNLLQACEQCNLSKSNEFPVKGNHVSAIYKESHIVKEAARNILTMPLSGEERLLLHPELDRVEDHIKFLPDGMVVEINNSDKGKESIRVYGLNRCSLVLLRKTKIDKYFKRLIYIFSKYEQRGADNLAYVILKNDCYDFLYDLLHEQDPTNEYSRLGYFMIDSFEDFFIKRLPIEEHRTFLRDFYTATIKN